MSDVATQEPTGAEAATEVVSAERAAADAGDVSSFLQADRAKRSGKPLEAVTRPKTAAEPAKGASGRVAAPAGKDGEAAKGPSAADRAADERLASRIREAVDTSTATLRKEADELRRRLDEATRKPADAGAAAATGAAPVKKGSTEYQRYLGMPDAPKAEDFDSIVEHNAAMSVFISDKRHEERTAASRQSTRELEQATADVERVKTFHGRIEEFKKADPTFATKLSDDVKKIHGWGRLQQLNAERQSRGEQPLPATVDHAIAEEIYDSEIPAQVAVYLSEHPDELTKLRGCKTPQALIRSFAGVEARARGTKPAESTNEAENNTTDAEARERADAAVDRSVSRADQPLTTLGKAGGAKDPLKHALSTGDIGAFLTLDREAMAERRGLRR